MNKNFSRCFICILILMFFSKLFVLEINAKSPIVAAYYENYSQYRPASGNRPVFSLAHVDPNLLTDIYFAFGTFGYITKSIDPSNPHLTGDFKIQPTESNDEKLYHQIQNLKKNSQNGLKAILSIGGWSFNDPNDPQGGGKLTNRLFSQMIASLDNRKQFIDSTIVYAKHFGFDGIDIDWEYPGDLNRGGSESDFKNFVEFLKEASEAFAQISPPLILSYAAPASIPQGLPEKYKDPEIYFKWIMECSKYLDRIGLMTYDYHGPFNASKITGVNSPLNRDTDPKSSLYILKTLQNYLNYGVSAKKIILGIPTFGHSYAGVAGLNGADYGPGKLFESAGIPGPSTEQAGFLAYYEISDRIAKDELIFGTDSVTNTAIGYNITTKNWISFDTPETVKLKAEVAFKYQLGGVMFWSLDNDEYQWEPKFPNIKSAKEVLKPNLPPQS